MSDENFMSRCNTTIYKYRVNVIYMNFIRRLFFKSDEGEAPDEKQELKKTVLAKIFQLEKSKVSKKNVDELAFIFRVFIINMFEIGEHLTIEEMIGEFNKKKLQEDIKEKIILFFSEISEAKYSAIKVNQIKFNKLILDFKKIIELV